MIVKVKGPLPAEYGLLKPGRILFTYLHLAANRELTLALVESGVTALGYETVEVHRRLPLLEPMSEIAGRMSIIMGGYFLAKHCGGNGVLLGGVPGCIAGEGGGAGGRDIGGQCGADGDGPGGGRDDPGGGCGPDALPGYHDAQREYAVLERGAPDRAACRRWMC